MKSLIMASMILLMGSSVFAADVIPNEVPVPEDRPSIEVPVMKPNYAGVNFSQRIGGDNHNSIGFVYGREVHDNVTVEGSYERSFNQRRNDSTTDMISGNILLGQHMGIISPYVLGGVGYEWRSNDSDRVVGIAGVGSKLHLTEDLDFDIRYRYVNGFDHSKRDSENIFTGGFNVRF